MKNDDLSFMNWGFNPSKREGEYMLLEASSEYADIGLYPPIFGSLEELVPHMRRKVAGNSSRIRYMLGEREMDYQIAAQQEWDKIMAFFDKTIPEIKKILDTDDPYTRIAGFDGGDWDIYTGFNFSYYNKQYGLPIKSVKDLILTIWTTDDETLGYVVKITKI